MTIDPRFASVAEAFDRVVAEQPGTGAALAVWHDGDWVLDLWGGWADAGRTRPWKRDSIVMPYSVSKPFAAVCALVLVDRGKLELDAPMQEYWPEFTAPATVRHVLSHQAGVVVLDDPAPTEVLYDWDALCALLARQQPLWEPGTALGEAALFYGHLVGELVRRVDGRSLGTFLREEIGGEFAFGLTPEEQERAVDITGLDEEFARTNTAGKPDIYPQAIGNPPGARDETVVNSPEWRAAEIPSVNGHGTARGAADLYARLLQGEILSADLLAEATRVQCSGPDLVFGSDSSWGLGFAVDEDGYGMGGTGGSFAAASVVGGYAMAFVTGSMGDHDRAAELENTFRACLGLDPLPD